MLGAQYLSNRVHIYECFMMRAWGAGWDGHFFSGLSQVWSGGNWWELIQPSR